MHSYTLEILVVLLLLFKDTIALSYGQQCDASAIYTATWQYDDSCQNVYLFCDPATNTCNYKGCANSDYMKEWNVAVHPYPPRCHGGTYCPDSNSKCTPLVQPGGHCELQRDDECAGNNAICLNSTCYIKAAPLSGGCATDVTDYVSYDATGNGVQQRIVRDNCTQGTYCVHSKCIPSKENGMACDQDRECISGTCSTDYVCINGPEVFRTIPTWLWAVVGVAVFLFVLATLVVLWILHRFQAKRERALRAKFFGDNEEFAKYAMLEQPDGDDNDGSRSSDPSSLTRSMVYLTTPEYNESAARATPRPLSFILGNKRASTGSHHSSITAGASHNSNTMPSRASFQRLNSTELHPRLNTPSTQQQQSSSSTMHEK
ncbi:hypothetical protein RO3G_11043 [Lichtheimia corymbifera JMRC:FSU:9682]|uniref:Uncharacterized protein n=1 Tax=Lichtheimia corymbifera JMRC:FSU:9682 TaxID=1263082 RepID=A0A068S6H7_9FUNG|nr:hypothetical protein RO3G_11043 [Lichtheimia corymbifera JMRC:FSU:9682]